MRFGIDYLAGAAFPDVVLHAHPTGWAGGFFANTFGNVFPLVRKLLRSGKCPEIRIHGVWADDTNHTYRPQEHWPMIRQAFRRCKALKRKWPDVVVQFSPLCEHTMNLETVTRIHGALEQMGLGGVVLVNSVWTGALIKGGLNEVHGYTLPNGQIKAPPPGRYNWSADGEDCFGMDMDGAKANFSRAETFYFWFPGCNLKRKLKEDPFIPIPQRTYKPQVKHIKALAYLANPRGDTHMDKGWLLKPLADDHGPGDPKSNKVVVIGPIQCSTLTLGNYTLRYFGPYEDGGHRYYSNQWGYEMAEDLGRPHKLMAGGKEIGVVNPAFRCGVYR